MPEASVLRDNDAAPLCNAKKECALPIDHQLDWTGGRGNALQSLYVRPRYDASSRPQEAYNHSQLDDIHEQSITAKNIATRRR